jgi:hypothetical protein
MGVSTCCWVKALALCLPLHAAGSEHLPPDVRQFVKRRDACDHLRAEAEGAAAAARANRACKGTDRQLARLKARHRHQPHLQQLLGSYEPRIEAR